MHERDSAEGAPVPPVHLRGRVGARALRARSSLGPLRRIRSGAGYAASPGDSTEITRPRRPRVNATVPAERA